MSSHSNFVFLSIILLPSGPGRERTLYAIRDDRDVAGDWCFARRFGAPSPQNQVAGAQRFELKETGVAKLVSRLFSRPRCHLCDLPTEKRSQRDCRRSGRTRRPPRPRPRPESVHIRLPFARGQNALSVGEEQQVGHPGVEQSSCAAVLSPVWRDPAGGYRPPAGH